MKFFISHVKRFVYTKCLSKMRCMKIRSLNHGLKFFHKGSRCMSTGVDPVKTALYDFHVEHQGKMVDFAGFLLPVQYGKESITTSHLHTREKCSIFDVSHMLQTKIHGDDRIELIERITTADVRGLPENKGSLTVFTDKLTGGILDDLIVTKTGDGYLYVVSNAGRRDHDKDLMLRTEKEMKAENKSVDIEFLHLHEWSLIAVQGPETAAVLQPLCDIPLDKLYFMQSSLATVAKVPGCRITRCGYTGEDGVEISVPSQHIADVTRALLTCKTNSVKLAGLGVRDSLRLEAGLCLYGNDIDVTVTPVEATLAWLVAKARRERKDFPGWEVILKQLSEGTTRKRVGLKSDKGPPPRHDCVIEDDSGNPIGKVTSGCPSPSIGGSVAMGYVEKQFAKSGTQVQVKIRGKPYSAVVSKMPFVPAKYYNG